MGRTFLSALSFLSGPFTVYRFLFTALGAPQALRRHQMNPKLRPERPVEGFVAERASHQSRILRLLCGPAAIGAGPALSFMGKPTGEVAQAKVGIKSVEADGAQPDRLVALDDLEDRFSGAPRAVQKAVPIFVCSRKRCMIFCVISPGLPQPKGRLSSEIMGMTSAAVPVRNASSAL